MGKKMRIRKLASAILIINGISYIPHSVFAVSSDYPQTTYVSPDVTEDKTQDEKTESGADTGELILRIRELREVDFKNLPAENEMLVRWNSFLSQTEEKLGEGNISGSEYEEIKDGTENFFQEINHENTIYPLKMILINMGEPESLNSGLLSAVSRGYELLSQSDVSPEEIESQIKIIGSFTSQNSAQDITGELRELMGYAGNINLGFYDPLSGEILSDALAESRRVLSGENPDPDDVSFAYKNLKNAVSSLEEGYNTERLYDLVLQARKITEASENLSLAVRDAENLLDSGEITKEKLKEYENLLSEEIEKSRKDTSSKTSENSGTLSELLNIVNGMDLSGYTEISILKLEIAADNAKKTLAGNSSADAAEAYNSLKAALKNLRSDVPREELGMLISFAEGMKEKNPVLSEFILESTEIYTRNIISPEELRSAMVNLENKLFESGVTRDKISLVLAIGKAKNKLQENISEESKNSVNTRIEESMKVLHSDEEKDYKASEDKLNKSVTAAVSTEKIHVTLKDLKNLIDMAHAFTVASPDLEAALDFGTKILNSHGSGDKDIENAYLLLNDALKNTDTSAETPKSQIPEIKKTDNKNNFRLPITGSGINGILPALGIFILLTFVFISGRKKKNNPFNDED